MRPNVRIEKARVTQGYIWGKTAANSNILKLLGDEAQALKLEPGDIVSELWIASDDPEHPSQVILEGGECIPLDILLEHHAGDILGDKHVRRYGKHLSVMMKLLKSRRNPFDSEKPFFPRKKEKPGHIVYEFHTRFSSGFIFLVTGHY